MEIFDSHCHLNDRAYKTDRDEVIDRARQAGVTAMMVVGITETTSKQAVDIAAANRGCYASVGVHPHDAKECSAAALDRLKQLADHPAVKAWGETGLDYNRMHSPKADQEKWFARQLEIAGELGLPLIFHERDSEGRFLEILSANGGSRLKGVVHCFSGTAEELSRYLEMGFYIGITGILTINGRGRALREMAATIPADRLLVETDAPYLTPAPEKNQTRRNEPAFVRRVLLKLAEVRNEDPAKLAATIRENTRTVFDIHD